jgi:hypothetical protein
MGEVVMVENKTEDAEKEDNILQKIICYILDNIIGLGENK